MSGQSSSSSTPAVPVVILDGGLGTILEAEPYNCKFTPDETPLWSSHLLITAPNLLEKVHNDYTASGAEIVLTATYQASVEGFAKTKRVKVSNSASATDGDAGLLKNASRHQYGQQGEEAHRLPEQSPVFSSGYYTPEEAADYMRSGVAIAGESTRKNENTALVALSLGPYGATLRPAAEYSGVYPLSMANVSSLKHWHAARLEIYNHWAHKRTTWDAVSFVAFETVRRCDEARAIRWAMTELNRHSHDRKWWLCAVFPVVEGQSLEEEAAEAEAMTLAMLDNPDRIGEDTFEEPWGIGINCTPLEKVARLVPVMGRTVSKLNESWRYCRWGPKPWLVLYPDGASGLRYEPASMRWIEKEEEEFSQGGGPGSSNKRRREAWAHDLGEIVAEAVKSGVWAGVIMGGCCKTDTADIQALRQVRDQFFEKPANLESLRQVVQS